MSGLFVDRYGLRPWVIVALIVLLLGAVGTGIGAADEDAWTQIDDRCYVHTSEDWRWPGRKVDETRAVYCEKSS